MGFGLQKGNLMENKGQHLSHGKADRLGGKQSQNMHQTLDVEESKAESVVDNVSAGGTRYIVGLKGGLKFYGQGSATDMHESMSQYSKSRGGGPMGEFNDNMSRIEYDNVSQNSGFRKNIDYDKQSVGSIEDENVGAT